MSARISFFVGVASGGVLILLLWLCVHLGTRETSAERARREAEEKVMRDDEIERIRTRNAEQFQKPSRRVLDASETKKKNHNGPFEVQDEPKWPNH